MATKKKSYKTKDGKIDLKAMEDDVLREEKEREMSEGENLPAVTANYAVSKFSGEQLREIIQANLGDARLSQFDLQRIHVPTGGGKTWQVGDEEMKEIQGVIVAWRINRAYWRESLNVSGGGSPPDCSSADGVTGVGDPGGDCEQCPLSRFGTKMREDGTPGRAQACKQMRVLFMVLPELLIPVAVVIPSGSLKEASRHFLDLLSRGSTYYSVITKLTLNATKNRDGITYSEVKFARGDTLPAAEQERMVSYARALAPLFESRGPATMEDYRGE